MLFVFFVLKCVFKVESLCDCVLLWLLWVSEACICRVRLVSVSLFLVWCIALRLFLWGFLCALCLCCWAIVFVAGVGFRFLLLSCGCGFCDVVSCVVVLRCDCLFVCCV